MRCIDKAGGFDPYIYHTKENKLQSELGMALKRRMKDVVDKFNLAPPVKVVRIHRRPHASLTESSSLTGQTSSVGFSKKKDNSARYVYELKNVT